MSIGSNIRKQRTTQRMSIATFCKKLDVNRNTVRRWESGEHEPRGATVKQIASVLGITTVALRAEEEANGTPSTRVDDELIATQKALIQLLQRDIKTLEARIDEHVRLLADARALIKKLEK